VRISDSSVFPVNTTLAAALVEVDPGRNAARIPENTFKFAVGVMAAGVILLLGCLGVLVADVARAARR